MSKPIDIAMAINKLDTFFEFSDSNIKWELENRNLERIKAFLSNNKGDLPDILTMLTNIGKTNYDRYLKHDHP